MGFAALQKNELNEQALLAALERSMLPQERQQIMESLHRSFNCAHGEEGVYQSEEWPQRLWYQAYAADETEQQEGNAPTELSPVLLQAIKESRSLLDLQDDWDGEGSPGYAEATWLRAIEFLTSNAKCLKETAGTDIPVPFIEPGPHGSIDLHWRTSTRELLINVPSDLNQLAGFYGDNLAGKSIKGKLNTSENNEWIMLWLMK
jgi:hypothetical protein